MKKTLVSFFVLVLMLSIMPMGLIRAEEMDMRTLTVSGFGQVETQADLAVLSFGVVSKNANAKLASQENTQRMTSVMEVLKDHKIKDEDIKTSRLSVYPSYEWLDNDTKFSYYEVRNIVEVKIRKLEDVGQIVADVISAGVNDFQSLEYTLEDSWEDFYLEALDLATKNATRKAGAISKALGESYELVPLKLVEEDSFGVGEPYAVQRSDFKAISSYELDATAPVPIAQDDLIIPARITLVFELVSK